MYTLTLSLTDEQRERAESQARERGYASPDEYLHDVVTDALDEAEQSDVDERTDDEILESLKTSLRQALRGEGRPIEELWKELEDGD
jgi:Arc/MetJ-type ribon-helix-helix transcriptional regulator